MKEWLSKYYMYFLFIGMIPLAAIIVMINIATGVPHGTFTRDMLPAVVLIPQLIGVVLGIIGMIYEMKGY
jgi:hypothetical protein